MRLSRRQFIQIGGTALGAAAVATPLLSRANARGAKDPGTAGDKVVPTFCEMCFWKCGVLAHVRVDTRKDAQQAMRGSNLPVRREDADVSTRREQRRRQIRGFLPILGAVIIDGMDLVTMGPVGIGMGMFVGGLLSWAVAYRHGLTFWQSLIAGTAGALYCALPFTEALPIATLLALISRNVIVQGRVEQGEPRRDLDGVQPALLAPTGAAVPARI